MKRLFVLCLLIISFLCGCTQTNNTDFDSNNSNGHHIENEHHDDKHH